MTKLTCQWQSISLLFVYFLINSIPTYGQAVIQSTRFPEEKKAHFFINNVFSTLGQSFKATRTGHISSISITLDKGFSPKDFNKQIDFWLDANPSKGAILKGVPRQIVTIPTNTTDGVLTLTLDKPFPVVKGKNYRMQFGFISEENTLSYLFSGSLKNPYPDGEVYFHNGMPQHTRDLDFSVAIN